MAIDPTQALVLAYLRGRGVASKERDLARFVTAVATAADRAGRTAVRDAAEAADPTALFSARSHFALSDFRSFIERGIIAARKVSLDIAQKIAAFSAKHFREPKPSEFETWSVNRTRQVRDAHQKEVFVEAQFQEQRKPSMSRLLIGFEVIGSDDANTRRGRPEDHGEHHLAALGLIAETTDAVWSNTTPIFGHGCRHLLRSVSRAEARRKGWLDRNERMPARLPANFTAYRPAPGFGHGG